MSGLLDEIHAAAEPVRRERPKHPDGWEPGVEWNGTSGRITAPTDNRVPDWRSLLEMWDFDPEQYEVVEPVQVRTWDAAIGNGEVRRMWYHRAQIRRRLAGAPDLDELIREVKRHRRRFTKAGDGAAIGSSAFVVVVSDPQLGKKGTAATVERFLDAIDAATIRLAELRKSGRVIDTIFLPSLGDLVEGCRDHYAMQQFEVELDKRAQVKLGRRLMLKLVERMAPLAPRVVVAAIGGNHGENRADGKAYTTFADNADVEIVEQVGEILGHNPDAYGHVRFLIPHDQLTLTVQPVEGGPIIGMAHGHQARRGGTTPQAKVREWWKGQAYGMRPVGDADILLTGHSHHLSIIADGPRTHIQAPTLDSGSQWWEETAGVPSHPAMLSFVITPTGWDDLKLL